jgi:hydrogenase expression/formation protein HypE
MSAPANFSLACPIPIQDYPQVLLAHGGGGTLMRDLIEKMFIASFGNAALDMRHDSALVEPGKGRIAFTTDSYVVRPLFFPGGDIGSLAVHGTVNDLAMSGARPLCLSCGFILEEGLPMETLWAIVLSMRDAAQACGAKIVTGDTKVVDRGKGDGIFINTAGIGVVEHGLTIAPQSVQPGDAILLSGDIGRHGIAVMSAREGLAFESSIASDSAPLFEPVQALLRAGLDVHCLRDLTRGGLSSALVEIAEASTLRFDIDEQSIAVRDDVGSACEILGLDPLYVANEGRFVAFVPARQAERARELLVSHPLCRNAAIIGNAGVGAPARVVMRTRLGTERVIDMLSGEQLPRIC